MANNLGSNNLRRLNTTPNTNANNQISNGIGGNRSFEMKKIFLLMNSKR